MEKYEFYEVCYNIVRNIPPGKVATYGQIALYAGYPRRARMAGAALSHAPENSEIPCHRVVNHAGRTAPGWPEQRLLLQLEGVSFRENGLVNLKQCLWQPAAKKQRTV